MSSNGKFNKAVNKAMNSNKTVGGASAMRSIFYFLIFLLLVVSLVLLLFLVQYLRTSCPETGKKDFWDYLLSFNLSGSPCSDPEPVKEYEEREIKDEEEVWNIKDQIYTFEEAKQKCKAYGSRLATKNEIANAYNKGAQWTNYGWSQGQNAYYPIQPCEYVKLRRQGLDVGPPGINGGKFNKHIRFGANCYGVKPPGEIVNPKSSECPWPDVCQRNPDACKPLKSDNIAPFFPEKLWSVWGPNSNN